MLQGPKDVMAVFVRAGVLNVIDARAGLWTYDGSIVIDANGDPIVAPTTFDTAQLGRGDRFVVIDTDGVAWLYDPVTGLWMQGVDTDDLLAGEAENTTNPWKRHNNILTPAITA